MEWVCPKCGFDNEKGSSFCGKCGGSLKKSCLKCKAEIRWDLVYCPECGFGIPLNEEIVYNKVYSGNGNHVVITNKRLLCFGGLFCSSHDITLDSILSV